MKRYEENILKISDCFFARQENVILNFSIGAIADFAGDPVSRPSHEKSAGRHAHKICESHGRSEI